MAKVWLVAVAVLMIGTGCQMKQDAQYSVRQPGDFVVIGGRASAELKWQFEVQCEGSRVCIANGIFQTDWDFGPPPQNGGVDGPEVSKRLQRLFSVGDGRNLMRLLRYDGSRCVVLGSTPDQATWVGGADCPYGESMVP